jgi:hypothetical protein
MSKSRFGSVVALVLAMSLGLGMGSPRARADVIEDLTAAELAAEWQVAWTVYKFYLRIPPPPLGLRRQVVRTLSIDIAAPRAHVFDVYSDIDNHIGRHPFLKAVTTHAEYESNGLHVRNFTATEDVPVAGVPVRLHTHAQQRINAASYYYESDSYDAPDVVTHQNVTFTDRGGGVTRVTEVIVFETNLALIDFTVTNGVSSHIANQQALKADIESGEL